MHSSYMLYLSDLTLSTLRPWIDIPCKLGMMELQVSISDNFIFPYSLIWPILTGPKDLLTVNFISQLSVLP